MKFIIATNSAISTNDGRNRLTQYLKEKGWDVWHWFQDLWLIADVPDEIDASQIRDELKSILPDLGRNILIIPVSGSQQHLSGVIPEASLSWILERWKPKDATAKIKKIRTT